MWWTLQIVGCMLVCVAQIVNRKFGVGIQSWVVFTGIAMFGTYFAFAKSYAIAPTFAHAWFVGQTALNILGFIGACLFALYLDKNPTSLLEWIQTVSIKEWGGISLSILGGYLLIK